ncbi:MAG: hypothetical protein Q8P41_11330 [Pseudomonadota bacterium]|nr:hypothetical protein [Pseudomonadota bacterium]
MKKALWTLGLLLLLGGGYATAAHLSGGAYPTFGLPLGGDRGLLRRTALAFWEDIQFKDFARAASYHAPEIQGSVDIPYLLERLFGIKPEMLDIMEIEVVLSDIDSTGLRARVKTRLKVKLLVDASITEREVMLYFHRGVGEPWYMELETSLRSIEAENGKKH